MQSADLTTDSNPRLAKAEERIRSGLASLSVDPSSRHAARARAIALIVADLTDDDEMLDGTLLYSLIYSGALGAEKALAKKDSNANRIASELVRLGTFALAAPSRTAGGLSPNQAEALRKMLLAIVTDPRLVLIKLAVELHRLRESKDAPPAERERIAYEVREIYAPL